MQPRRGIIQYISERTRGLRLWPPTISERSYIEAFFDSVTASATEDGWRQRQESRGLQHPTRKSHAQATASRRTHDSHDQDPWQRPSPSDTERNETPTSSSQLHIHSKPDGRAEPALLDSGLLHPEWTWNNNNNNKVTHISRCRRNETADDPASRHGHNRWRPRVRTAKSLTRNLMTVLRSIGSSNTAVDPDEREALLAADWINASSMGDVYESTAVRDEESYLDINGQHAGVQSPASARGDLNV